jgi:hypothetical protein
MRALQLGTESKYYKGDKGNVITKRYLILGRKTRSYDKA